VAQTEDDRRCPRCSTPYNDGQEYCLECGERQYSWPSLYGVSTASNAVSGYLRGRV